MSTGPQISKQNLKHLIAVGLACLAVAAWIGWRYTTPVEVRFFADAPGLPLDIEAIPPVVAARPGEMVKVVYRISNTDLLPVSAFGSVSLSPENADSQLQFFLVQCGGLNTFQNNFPQEYEVIFRVEPAGLFNYSQITVVHKFESVATHEH